MMLLPLGRYVTSFLPVGPFLRFAENQSRGDSLDDEIDVFVNSDSMRNLLSNLPSDDTETWQSELKTALMLFDKSTRRGLGEVDAALAVSLCVLLKGNYYIQEKLDLERLREESWQQYCLHAAAGLIDPCPCPPAVVEYLLRQVPDQTTTKAFGDGRLPLHVAAATPLETSPTDRVVNLGLLLHADTSAAKHADDFGQYPIDLARTSGYKWQQGLEPLWRAAPYYSTGKTGVSSSKSTLRQPALTKPVNSLSRVLLQRNQSRDGSTC